MHVRVSFAACLLLLCLGPSSGLAAELTAPAPGGMVERPSAGDAGAPVAAPEAEVQRQPGQQAGPSGQDTDYVGSLVPIVVPLGFFAFVLAVVAVPFYFRTRAERFKQDTVRAIIEKGGQIPPELLLSAEPPARQRSIELRRGVILLALGVGLAAFFFLESGGKGLGIAFIPAALGLGYLLVWKLDQRS